ncbi:nectin-4-like isoform X2 [Myxocyprinus asiaticus]|uniref:nectin-4-like isoform X2 n=1 Tax=Myxocyprinus asiaticus TaxID=70543 RepID=UPI0022220356|nr:nectin-4-like isoform X2 [Myxocyprinus asiaticus]
MDSHNVIIFLMLYHSTVLTVLQGQRIHTVPEVVGYQGHDVTLPCSYNGDPEDKLSQVEWTLRNQSSESTSLKIIILSPTLGIHIHETFLKDRVSFSKNSSLISFLASIIIKDVKKSDQGVYSCEYAIFPSGSYKGETTLKVIEEELAIPATAPVLLIYFTSSLDMTQRPDVPQQDVIYADVTILKPGRVNKNLSKADVEYAAVFSSRSGSSSLRGLANQQAFGDHTAEQESVYAQVKKD